MLTGYDMCTWLGGLGLREERWNKGLVLDEDLDQDTGIRQLDGRNPHER